MKLTDYIRWPFTRSKATSVTVPSAQAVPYNVGNWFNTWVQESFPGAWQRNIVADGERNLLAFPAVYACIEIISNDIAKLPINLVRQNTRGIWEKVEGNSPFWPVLRKPNAYQTRVQFMGQWLQSKLMHGNTFALKARDERGIVVGLYILDPNRVTPLVTPDGGVYYELRRDELSRLGNEEPIVVPASEIIHDRMMCLWHPLVGISPLYAGGTSATQGLRIQNNSNKFFENMSRPSGILVAPGTISDETAKRLKEAWESNFTGGNIGRVAVVGDDLKYQEMTIPAATAQLMEQLKWTAEDVARTMLVPLYKLGLGPNPTFNNIGALNQDYYNNTLQIHFEAIEALLDEGLRLPSGMGTEFDLKNLLRMDPVSRAQTYKDGIGAGFLSPNEARFEENLEPKPGGDTPYMQQQMWSLEQLNNRTGPDDLPALPAPKPETAPAPSKVRSEEDQEAELGALISKFDATNLAFLPERV
jgi:HK97 family phage portal protein